MLVFSRVFVDLDLLTTISQNYDLVAKMVRRVDGQCLVKITMEEIQEVFGMIPTIDYHEVVDF